MSHVVKHQTFLPNGGSLNQRYGNGDFRVWYLHGDNNSVDGATEEDIWNPGGKEVLPSAPISLWAACTDNVNGQGQVLRVDGLDENWAYKTDFVTLTGTTPALVGDALSWTRLFQAYQVSADPDPVGDVYFGDDDTDFLAGVPQTASTIHAFVNYTEAPQASEKAMFTVPAGHECLIYAFSSAIAEAAVGVGRSAEVFIEVAELAQGASVATPTWAPFRRIDQHSLRSDGASLNTETFVFPLGPFPQLTNIHVRATATAASEILADLTLVTYEV